MKKGVAKDKAFATPSLFSHVKITVKNLAVCEKSCTFAG